MVESVQDLIQVREGEGLGSIQPNKGDKILTIVNQISRKLSLALSSTLILLTGFFAFLSTPIADDYCFALAAGQDKIIENTVYYTTQWSPLPLGYLIQNTWWATSKNGNLSSFLITLPTFIILILSWFFLFKFFLRNQDRKFVFLVIGVYFSSIALSKTGTFLTYSHPNPGNYPIIELGKKVLSDLPDGRLSYWYFNTPLISGRTILIASILLMAALWILKRKKITYHLIFFSLFVATFSLSESLYLGTALTLYVLFSNKQIKRNLTVYISIVILLLIPILLTLLGASKNRQANIVEFSFLLFSYKTVLILAYLTASIYILNTLVLGSLAALILVKYCSEVNFEIVRSLRNLFTILAISSFLVESAISAYAYSAEYHWTTLHAFSFLAQFFAVLYKFRGRQLNSSQKNTAILASFFIYSAAILLTLQNVDLSNSRVEKWKERSELSITQNANVRISIPRADLRGNPLVGDLDINYKTIVPDKGYVNDAAYVCFKNLPVGW